MLCCSSVNRSINGFPFFCTVFLLLLLQQYRAADQIVRPFDLRVTVCANPWVAQLTESILVCTVFPSDQWMAPSLCWKTNEKSEEMTLCAAPRVAQLTKSFFLCGFPKRPINGIQWMSINDKTITMETNTDGTSHVFLGRKHFSYEVHGPKTILVRGPWPSHAWSCTSIDDDCRSLLIIDGPCGS